MSSDHSDAYAEITAACRRAVRAYHPDAPHPDRDRLAAVITAYHQLRGNDDPPPTLRQRGPPRRGCG